MSIQNMNVVQLKEFRRSQEVCAIVVRCHVISCDIDGVVFINKKEERIIGCIAVSQKTLCRSGGDNGEEDRTYKHFFLHILNY